MYEDYMQNYFASQMNNQYQNTYDQNSGYQFENPEYLYQNRYRMPNYNFDYYQNRDININNNFKFENIENYYPEIYNVIYPMVKKACSRNIQINKENYCKIVDEIYNNLETNERIELNINLENNVGSRNENSEGGEPDQENRIMPPRDNILKDLIGILVIRELLSRPGCCKPRPMPGMGFGMQPGQYRFF